MKTPTSKRFCLASLRNNESKVYMCITRPCLLTHDSAKEDQAREEHRLEQENSQKKQSTRKRASERECNGEKRKIQPLHDVLCLAEQCHRENSAKYDACPRWNCAYMHKDQRDYRNSNEYQEDLRQERITQWLPQSYERVTNRRKNAGIEKKGTKEKAVDKYLKTLKNDKKNVAPEAKVNQEQKDKKRKLAEASTSEDNDGGKSKKLKGKAPDTQGPATETKAMQEQKDTKHKHAEASTNEDNDGNKGKKPKGNAPDT